MAGATKPWAGCKCKSSRTFASHSQRSAQNEVFPQGNSCNIVNIVTTQAIFNPRAFQIFDCQVTALKVNRTAVPSSSRFNHGQRRVTIGLTLTISGFTTEKQPKWLEPWLMCNTLQSKYARLLASHPMNILWIYIYTSYYRYIHINQLYSGTGIHLNICLYYMFLQSYWARIVAYLPPKL